MENGKIKVWLPAIRAGTGTDMFTLRLAQAFESRGLLTHITWFPLRYEVAPTLLRKVPTPSGTDIIFTNSSNGFAFGGRGRPLVVTLHHSDFGSTSRAHLSWAQFLYRKTIVRRNEARSFRAAGAITAVSRFVANTLENTPYHDKVEVIHNWIDTKKFHPIARDGASAKPFRLLFVGKSSYLKGADMLPGIMSELGDGFQLFIAGKIKNGENGSLTSNMAPLGWLTEEQMIGAYQDCDALLFPSRSEGCPYTALEAMACGKPVITSNTSSLPEFVVDGHTGMLCLTGDVGSFVSACRKLAANTDLARGMGLAARQSVSDNYAEEKSVGRYMQLIERLLDTRRIN